jgi:hypothetical protein
MRLPSSVAGSVPADGAAALSTELLCASSDLRATSRRLSCSPPPIPVPPFLPCPSLPRALCACEPLSSLATGPFLGVCAAGTARVTFLGAFAVPPRRRLSVTHGDGRISSRASSHVSHTQMRCASHFPVPPQALVATAAEDVRHTLLQPSASHVRPSRSTQHRRSRLITCSVWRSTGRLRPLRSSLALMPVQVPRAPPFASAFCVGPCFHAAVAAASSDLVRPVS